MPKVPAGQGGKERLKSAKTLANKKGKGGKKMSQDELKVNAVIEKFKEKSGLAVTAEAVLIYEEELAAKRAFITTLRKSKALGVDLLCVAVCYCVLLCVVVCCSVLQCVGVCCCVLLCVYHYSAQKQGTWCGLAMFCCVLLCVAMCCSVL